MAKYSHHVLRPGDLLVTRSGTCGLSTVFQGHTIPVLPGAFLIRFRLSRRALPEFVSQYLNSPLGRIRVEKLATGAVQQNLTSKVLLDLTIPVPSILEQERVVRLLGTIDAKIKAERRRAEGLNSLCRTLRESLASGRTVHLVHQSAVGGKHAR
jgi:type I restriction enzyme S subunit